MVPAVPLLLPIVDSRRCSFLVMVIIDDHHGVSKHPTKLHFSFARMDLTCDTGPIDSRVRLFGVKCGRMQDDLLLSSTLWYHTSLSQNIPAYPFHTMV
jgi:hypothetical protein